MLRHLLTAPAGLILAVIAVSATALVAGTVLATGQLLALAQSSIQFQAAEIELLVKENIPAGGSVGPPVAAIGGDVPLTYSLSGTDAGLFTINTGAGQILLGQYTSLDYESGKTTYRLVVTATGQPGQTGRVDVIVIVENLNEPPEFDIDNIFFRVIRGEGKHRGEHEHR